MKTLKAFGIAALLAATATSAAFAGQGRDSDAASQTPFLYQETSNGAAVTRGNASFIVTPSAAHIHEDDAAVQTPFIYEQ